MKLIEINAKCRHLKKWPGKRLWGSGLSAWRPLVFGVVEQFFRFRTWSDTECKTLAEYGLQHDSTPPNPSQQHTVFIYCTWNREGGSSNQREGESSDHKVGSKIPTRLNVRKKSSVQGRTQEGCTGCTCIPPPPPCASPPRPCASPPSPAWKAG